MNDLTYYVPCVHRMPRGFCDIKRELCTYGNGVPIQPILIAEPYKIEPSWNEVTCSTEKIGKSQKSYADWELRSE